MCDDRMSQVWVQNKMLHKAVNVVVIHELHLLKNKVFIQG